MKQIIKNYSFDKTARTVTFTDFSTVGLDRLFLITNVTAGVIVYQFNDPALGGSVVGNVLTLAYDTSAMANTDKLQIVYDSAAGDPTYDASTTGSVQGTVASGNTDSGNPIKIGGKYNATAITLADGQRGDLQLDANANIKTNLTVKLDPVNDGITTYPVGHSVVNISANATTTVKSGSGVLVGIVINNPAKITVADLTLTIYDNTAASGTKLGTLTVPYNATAAMPFKIPYALAFVTGLTIVTAGPTVAADITVEYR